MDRSSFFEMAPTEMLEELISEKGFELGVEVAMETFDYTKEEAEEFVKAEQKKIEEILERRKAAAKLMMRDPKNWERLVRNVLERYSRKQILHLLETSEEAVRAAQDIFSIDEDLAIEFVEFAKKMMAEELQAEEVEGWTKLGG